MKKFLLLSLSLVLFTASNLYGQEICDNGVDDDGDGLIDINDGDCLCGVLFDHEFRGDFEEFECCPSGISQFDCIGGGWVQANDFTPDYFNTCGFMGGVGVPEVPLPIPSGEGCIGFMSCGGCHDNAGLCMPYTMLPGETYDVSFYVGFNEGQSLFSDLDVEISIFGSDDCSSLPTNDAFCLSDFEAWYDVGIYGVQGTSLNSWVHYADEFIASKPTKAIAIGTSCAFSADAQSQYHFFDDIRISGKFFEPSEEAEIEFHGDCGTGYYLEATDNTGISYQWYIDGVAIDGVGNPYPVPLGQDGNYQVLITYGDGTCSISHDLEVETNPFELEIDGIVVDVDCSGDENGSIDILVSSMNLPFVFEWNTGANDGYIDGLAPGNYTVTVTDNNGCKTIETYTIEEPDLLELGVYVEQPTQDTPLGYAEIIITGGTAPYLIGWSNGNDEISDDSLIPGLYQVIVVDVNGCQDVINFEIFEPLSFTVDYMTESCFDACNGSITITDIFGGVPPYEIDWNIPGSSAIQDELCAGGYSFVIEDAFGTVLWGDIDLEPGTDMELDLEYQEVLCSMDDLTSIDLTVFGGLEPYTFDWSNGMVEEDILEAPAGSYSLTVSDASGCTVETDFLIDFSIPIEIEEEITEAPCGIEGLGAVNISLSGGSEPYSFNWNTGAITEDIDSLFSGIYEVTIIDVNDCSLVQSFEVTSNTDMAVLESISPISCPSDLTGSISLDVQGGSGPINIIWSTGGTTNELTALGVGEYSVTVTDALNCTWINNYVLEPSSQLSIEEAITPVTCFGESTGSIELEITSSGSISSYTWDNGMTSEDLIDLPAGNYDLTILDDYGCSYEYTFEIEEQDAFAIDDQIVDVNCFGGQDGAINVSTLTNGTYDFLWNNGSVTNSIIDQLAGQYNLTITNDLGCEQYYDFIIDEPTLIEANPTLVHAGCVGTGLGSIEISPSGGVAPYTYQWNTGGMTSDIVDLSAGMYEVTITDSNDCRIEVVYEINEAMPFSVSESINNVLCHGAEDGEIAVEITGGTPPFNYAWSTGGTGPDENNLGAGMYTVVITDANDCREELDFIVEEPVELSVTETIQDARCFGETGTIDVEVSGGVGPYNLIWSNGETANQMSTVAGMYTLEIQDANGCILQNSYTINEPMELTASVSSLNAPSQIGDDGSVSLDINGGTSPYTVNWSNGSIGAMLNNLGFGTHTATIIDANGCETTVELTLTPEEISVNYAINSNPCFGECVGEISLEISGGQEPYNVNWSNGGSGVFLTDLCSGVYTAMITDALGSEVSIEELEIQSPTQLELASLITDLSCVGTNDGSIITMISGGQAPYDYQWEVGATTNELDNLPPGSYELLVIDANGCEIREAYEIEDVDELDLNLVSIPADCESGFGSIRIEGDLTGGLAFYIDEQEVQVGQNGWVENVEVGEHTFNYSLNTDCRVSLGEFEINSPIEVELLPSITEVELKLDESVELSIEILSNEEISGYDLDWQSINPINCIAVDTESACITIDLIGIESERLNVVLIDEQGCSYRAEIDIRVIEPPVIVMPNIFSPNGDGDNEELIFYTSRKVEQVSQFLIYDRWGNMMHEQRGVDSAVASWDGRSSGSNVSAGVYIYFVELNMVDGSKEIFTGDLTLIR